MNPAAPVTHTFAMGAKIGTAIGYGEVITSPQAARPSGVFNFTQQAAVAAWLLCEPQSHCWRSSFCWQNFSSADPTEKVDSAFFACRVQLFFDASSGWHAQIWSASARHASLQPAARRKQASSGTTFDMGSAI